MNNEIYYGDRMHSGEFGHMTLEINGRQCYCGKKGCVDAYCKRRIFLILQMVTLESSLNLLKQAMNDV